MTDDIWEAALAERKAQESESIEAEENPEAKVKLCNHCYGDNPVPCHLMSKENVSRETSSLDQVKAKLRSFLDEGGPWTITKDEWATYKDLLFM